MDRKNPVLVGEAKMRDALAGKIDRLKEQLAALKKVAVAFSGGKDSFFMLKIAIDTLGQDNALAFFARSDFLTENDQKRVDYFRRRFDLSVVELAIDPWPEEKIVSNPLDRCYHCKKKIFLAFREKASALGIAHLLDGTTHSDLDQYRPGLKALHELGILSPLRDVAITSGEVVEYLAAELGIDDYFLTSSTCLATRFPYHHRLTREGLKTFAAIEGYFVDRGFYPVRIRYMEEGVRIEAALPHFEKILEKRDEIIAFCKGLGIKFITLDLEGIKSGVWD